MCSLKFFESTVFPGVTEEICAPVLEKESGLVCGKDFKIGYSPERINPGDGGAIGGAGPSVMGAHTIDDAYGPNCSALYADNTAGCSAAQSSVGGVRAMAQLGMGCYGPPGQSTWLLAFRRTERSRARAWPRKRRARRSNTGRC